MPAQSVVTPDCWSPESHWKGVQRVGANTTEGLCVYGEGRLGGIGNSQRGRQLREWFPKMRKVSLSVCVVSRSKPAVCEVFGCWDSAEMATGLQSSWVLQERVSPCLVRSVGRREWFQGVPHRRGLQAVTFATEEMPFIFLIWKPRHFKRDFQFWKFFK